MRLLSMAAAEAVEAAAELRNKKSVDKSVKFT